MWGKACCDADATGSTNARAFLVVLIYSAVLSTIAAAWKELLETARRRNTKRRRGHGSR